MATIGEQGPVSTHTLEKVTRAKVTLENYYTNLINQNGERESRLVSNIVALVGVCTLVRVCVWVKERDLPICYQVPVTRKEETWWKKQFFCSYLKKIFKKKISDVGGRTITLLKLRLSLSLTHTFVFSVFMRLTTYHHLTKNLVFFPSHENI